MKQTLIEQQTTAERFHVSDTTNQLSFLFPQHKPARSTLNGVYILIGLQGTAIVEIDGESYSFREGTLICLTPNHLLSASAQSDRFLFEYISFEYDFLSDFPLLLKADISDKMGIRPVLQLDEPTFTMVKNYHDFIFNRHNENNNRTEVIKGLLFSFITEVSEIYSKQHVVTPLSRQKALADNFFQLLHKHYKTEKTAAFYAAQLCITDKYLSRVIRQVTGKTFHFWSSDFIIKEAKLLLRSTVMSVTEISESLEFPNSSFFARFFRRHTGMSPMQFRAKSDK